MAKTDTRTQWVLIYKRLFLLQLHQILLMRTHSLKQTNTVLLFDKVHLSKFVSTFVVLKVVSYL